MIEINEEALDAAADELIKHGDFHHWWGDFKSSPMKEFKKTDPIGHEEFTTIVWRVIEKYLEKSSPKMS